MINVMERRAPTAPAEAAAPPNILECMQRLDRLIEMPAGSSRITIFTPGGLVGVQEVVGQRFVTAMRPDLEVGFYHGMLVPSRLRVEYTPTAENASLLSVSGGPNATPEAINNWLGFLICDVEAIINPMSVGSNND